MTTTSTPRRTTPSDGSLEGRRILVTLGVIYLGLFVVLIGTSSDRSPNDDPTKLITDYKTGDTTIEVITYATVVAGIVLVFYGAALRSALVARTRRWTADAALLGFVVMALSVVGFAVTGLALHHAVDIGNPQVVQAINILDTTNFPLAMLGMSCAMIGVGLSARGETTMPTWLCWASIVLGVMAPLGPLGFAPFVLFPVWVVVVAAFVRLSDS